MVRCIIALILLAAPAMCLAQATQPAPDPHQSADWWLDRARRKANQFPETSPTRRELLDLVLGCEVYRGDTKGIFERVEQQPDDKADFHLGIYADLAGRFAQIGKLDDAREALDRAKDSPVAKHPSCRRLILAATFRIDAATKDFPAALKDIQQSDPADQFSQYLWLEDQATAAHQPDIARLCIEARLKLADLNRTSNETHGAFLTIAFRFLVQSGHTNLVRWIAENSPADTGGNAYAELAIHEPHSASAIHATDVQNAVASALSSHDIGQMLNLCDLFAAGDDLEGNKQCANRTADAGAAWFGASDREDFSLNLSQMQLFAHDLDAAILTARTAQYDPPYIMSRIGRFCLEQGNIDYAMRVCLYQDDPHFAYDIGRKCALLSELDNLRNFTEGDEDCAMKTWACCGAAEGIGLQATTRP